MATKYTFESSTTTTYEFHDKITPPSHRRHNNNSSSSKNNNNNNFHHQHRRQTSKDSHDGDPTDGSGSLTYSAASSINSAGESTDSSFADILRVLDVQDSKELAAYLRKDGGGGGHHHRKDEKSVAESLAYSMDAESCMKSMATDNESGLHGADLLSTFTGQASDQKFDGGAYYSSAGGAGGHGSGAPGAADRDEPDLGGDDLNIFFSPAEHTDSLKRRKDRKRRERNEKMMNALANANGQPQQQQQQQAPGQQQQQQQQQLGSPKGQIQQPSNQQSSQQQQRSKAGISSSSSSYSSGTNNHSSSSSTGTNSRPYPQDAIRIESRQGTPPTSRPPKRSSGWNHMDMTYEDEDVWYAKWWMFCFPDAVKNMTEKR